MCAYLCLCDALVSLFDECHQLPNVVQVLPACIAARLAVLILHLAPHLHTTPRHSIITALRTATSAASRAQEGAEQRLLLCMQR